MAGFGSKIKELRDKRGWTQEMLGDMMGKSPQSISSYELGRQNPPADVLISLSSIFHVSIDELAGNTRGKTISVGNYSPEKQNVIDLIIAEFDEPTGVDGNLSPQQIKIIQKLMLLFSL